MTTSFAQTQFGKPIKEVSKDDLTVYFSTERSESLTLEYKSFYQHEGDIKHKEKGILRTICGFLNSNGGLLIWGAPVESKNVQRQKVCIGELSPVEKRYSKDDFINKMSTRIAPFSSAVQIEAVEVEQGKFVYLIDVPESEAKPHQFDDIFYMRLSGSTRIAPYYIIDALFKQVKIPSLSVFMRPDGFTNRQGELYYNSVNILFTCFLINSSRFIHDYDPYYILDPIAGGFINDTTNDIERPLHIHDIPTLKILKYNMPLVRQEVFHLSMKQYHEWCDLNKPIPISIMGGGRVSPLVNSTYELELVDASKNKDLVLSKHVPFERVFNFKPISLNQFKHDEWTGSEEDRLNAIVKKVKAR